MCVSVHYHECECEEAIRYRRGVQRREVKNVTACFPFTPFFFFFESSNSWYVRLGASVTSKNATHAAGSFVVAIVVAALSPALLPVFHSGGGVHNSTFFFFW
jgi:hypothetical protein